MIVAGAKGDPATHDLCPHDLYPSEPLLGEAASLLPLFFVKPGLPGWPAVRSLSISDLGLPGTRGAMLRAEKGSLSCEFPVTVAAEAPRASVGRVD